jgi:hypothetical protein
MRRLTVLFLCALAAMCASGASAAADVTLARGELEHFALSNELFHIDNLWIRVAENTEFHRWLSEGIGHNVAINLTTSAARAADEKDTRILTGTLIHNTAPRPTSNTVDVTGRLPPGDMDTVHELFLRDETTGTLGAVTFETSDSATVLKFEGYDNARVSIVLKIE